MTMLESVCGGALPPGSSAGRTNARSTSQLPAHLGCEETAEQPDVATHRGLEARVA